MTIKNYVNQVFNEDAISGLARIPDGAIDLIITEPPCNLRTDCDTQEAVEYLKWMEQWIDAALPKLKATGSLYIFVSWYFSPEIFVMLKKRMTMLNEIIWDRVVPATDDSERSFTPVHDSIGFFAVDKGYYFDLDAVRIPYDAETKKARSRSIFVGAKWLEIGYNPKDLWTVSHNNPEDELIEQAAQKPLEIAERMVKASCPPDGIVLDPFMGGGTTAVAAQRCGRRFVGFEKNAVNCEIIANRLASIEGCLSVKNNQPSEPIRSKPTENVKGKRGAKRKQGPEQDPELPF